jgi:PASTA domain
MLVQALTKAALALLVACATVAVVAATAGAANPGPTQVANLNAGKGISATSAKQCIVPNVKGKRLAKAEKVLKKAHCGWTLFMHYSSRVAKGRVIEQKPEAGAERPAGWEVELTVSRGKKHHKH